jgi:D-alanyl-D-alanine carboxypeptidase (penicillin-binding protein 5/6)
MDAPGDGQPSPVVAGEPSAAIPGELSVPAVGPASPEPRRGWGRRVARRRKDRGRHRRIRPRRLKVRVVVVVVAVGSVAAVVAVRLDGTYPPAAVEPALPMVTVPGHPPTISWPPGVAAAFALPALGISGESGSETPMPIASLTKLMTALVVLRDHPLALGAPGPSITITPADVALYEDDVASDQTNIEVEVGEVLTEYQLLEGMLVHSANNFADLLAIYDAGSVSTFVAKMNADARALGMTDTRYTDASGYAEDTVSTPSDQLKVAAADLADPVFDQIVDMVNVTLPIAGSVASYTPLVGLDGVVGLKSGFTTAAGGCDVLGMLRDVAGVPVEVLAAVVGYRMGVDVVDGAGLAALAVARQVMSAVRAVTVVRHGERVGTARADGTSVPVVSRRQAVVVGWPGQQPIETLHVAVRPRPGSARGTSVGWVTVVLGSQKIRAEVATGRRLATPSIWQRVL